MRWRDKTIQCELYLPFPKCIYFFCYFTYTLNSWTIIKEIVRMLSGWMIGLRWCVAIVSASHRLITAKDNTFTCYPKPSTQSYTNRGLGGCVFAMLLAIVSVFFFYFFFYHARYLDFHLWCKIVGKNCLPMI